MVEGIFRTLSYIKNLKKIKKSVDKYGQVCYNIQVGGEE